MILSWIDAILGKCTQSQSITSQDTIKDSLPNQSQAGIQLPLQLQLLINRLVNAGQDGTRDPKNTVETLKKFISWEGLRKKDEEII